MSDFQNRLSELLNDNHLSPVEMAEMIGVNSSTVSRWIHKGIVPKRDTINKIAITFEVNPKWLLGFDVSKEFEKDQKKDELADCGTIMQLLLKNATNKDLLMGVQSYLQILISNLKDESGNVL